MPYSAYLFLQGLSATGFFCGLFFLTSCVTVNYDYQLPDQSLDKSDKAGKTCVIFYNALNPLFLDGSWRIGIKIDDVGVQNLHIKSPPRKLFQEL